MESRLLKLITIITGCIVVFTVPYLQTPTHIGVRSDNNALVAAPQIAPTSSETTILLGGDVMLGRSVTIEALDRQKNALYPFEKIQNVLNSADIVFVNLENPIVEHCPRKNDGMVFCAPPSMLEGLKFRGESIVNLANNHTKNYGESGMAETLIQLHKHNIATTGVGKLTIKKKQGTSIGFLGFDKSQQDRPQLTSDEQLLISDSKKSVDILVVALHWGVEYNNHPTDGQRRLAQEIVDLGADVIVGHHPHWVQDLEKIGDVPVYYSLGNLVFDQMWSEETRHGVMVKLTFSGGKIVKEEHIPTYIEKTGQPTVDVSQNPS